MNSLKAHSPKFSSAEIINASMPFEWLLLSQDAFLVWAMFCLPMLLHPDPLYYLKLFQNRLLHYLLEISWRIFNQNINSSASKFHIFRIRRIF